MTRFKEKKDERIIFLVYHKREKDKIITYQYKDLLLMMKSHFQGQEVEFHEIEIQLFHEVEFSIMRSKLTFFMRSDFFEKLIRRSNRP